jgi:hypothetical protein
MTSVLGQIERKDVAWLEWWCIKENQEEDRKKERKKAVWKHHDKEYQNSALPQNTNISTGNEPTPATASSYIS